MRIGSQSHTLTLGGFMSNATLQIRVSDHKFNATLAYLAALWTRDESVSVTVYPMRKVAQMAKLA